jgi:hypothetical protein
MGVPKAPYFYDCSFEQVRLVEIGPLTSRAIDIMFLFQVGITFVTVTFGQVRLHPEAGTKRTWLL